MRWGWGILGILLALWLCNPTHAQDSEQCAEHKKLVGEINGKYQEYQRHIGILDGSKEILEIFRSSPGTWTIVVTDGAGRSCVVAAGGAWEDVPQLIPGQAI